MSNSKIYSNFFDNRDEAIVIFDKKFKIIYHNHKLNTLCNVDNTTNFKTLDEIFTEKNQNKIKENSTLFKSNSNSNNYSILYKNKFLILKSTFINADKNKGLDFTIISDESKKQRDIKLKECIYKISESSHFVSELDQLYPLIHEILEDVLEKA